jgi:hypothetical protein
VWEFVNPYWGVNALPLNMVYRAYRVPYEWVPQAKHPEHVAIEKINTSSFRVPGAAPLGPQSTVTVKGTIGFYTGAGHCVGATD